jgi:hypothetical protein
VDSEPPEITLPLGRSPPHGMVELLRCEGRNGGRPRIDFVLAAA